MNFNCEGLWCEHYKIQSYKICVTYWKIRVKVMLSIKGRPFVDSTSKGQSCLYPCFNTSPVQYLLREDFTLSQRTKNKNEFIKQKYIEMSAFISEPSNKTFQSNADSCYFFTSPNCIEVLYNNYWFITNRNSNSCFVSLNMQGRYLNISDLLVRFRDEQIRIYQLEYLEEPHIWY